MGRKGNLAVFESSSISETGEVTPTKIGVHACDINSYSHNVLSRFRLIKFLMTMDYSPWVEREIWPFLRVAVSPKLKGSHPSKSMYMKLTPIPTCMNFLSRFRSIKIFDEYSPWVKREI